MSQTSPPGQLEAEVFDLMTEWIAFLASGMEDGVRQGYERLDGLLAG